MKQINSWHIDDGMEATFENDDFETWWLAGMDETDRILKKHQRELYENCLYLAEAESRHMTQSVGELMGAIGDWANKHNANRNS